MPRKEKYERRKSKGLCVMCGSQSAIEGYSLCQSCRQKSTANSDAYRQNRKDQGLCAYCDNENTSNTFYCDRCSNMKIEYNKQRNLIRTQLGLCLDCDNQAKEDDSYCKNCIAKRHKNYSQRYYRLKSQGICTTCGKNNAALGSVRCETCKEKYAKTNYLVDRVADKKCKRCGKPNPVPRKQICNSCRSK